MEVPFDLWRIAPPIGHSRTTGNSPLRRILAHGVEFRLLRVHLLAKHVHLVLDAFPLLDDLGVVALQRLHLVQLLVEVRAEQLQGRLQFGDARLVGVFLRGELAGLQVGQDRQDDIGGDGVTLGAAGAGDVDAERLAIEIDETRRSPSA